MHPTLFANTWAVAHLPGERYMALLCCGGIGGEAAFHNSLDEAFAEVGHSHLPTTLNHRRPPTYQVIGTTLGMDGSPSSSSSSSSSLGGQRCDATVKRACVGKLVAMTTQRIVRSNPHGNHQSAHSWVSIPPFQHATLYGNALVVYLHLTAVTLDMGHMLCAKELPDGFMRSCGGLARIVLPPNVEEIGRDALCGCTGLTVIDMRNMLYIKLLPSMFLGRCVSLTSVKFPPNVEVVSCGVLIGCTGLTEMDMSGLLRLNYLGGNFMFGCSSVTSVTFPPNVAEIVGPALAGCIRLTELKMSSLLAVAKLPATFLCGGCNSLLSIQFPPPNVATAEIISSSSRDGLGDGCGRLTNITTCPPPPASTREIEDVALLRCSSLTKVNRRCSEVVATGRFGRQEQPHEPQCYSGGFGGGVSQGGFSAGFGGGFDVNNIKAGGQGCFSAGFGGGVSQGGFSAGFGGGFDVNHNPANSHDGERQ